jgi:hypothetical protein
MPFPLVSPSNVQPLETVYVLLAVCYKLNCGRNSHSERCTESPPYKTSKSRAGKLTTLLTNSSAEGQNEKCGIRQGSPKAANMYVRLSKKDARS